MARKTGHMADLARRAKAERAAKTRLRNAAPELAEALSILMPTGEHPNYQDEPCECHQCIGFRLGKAALAKAGA